MVTEVDFKEVHKNSQMMPLACLRKLYVEQYNKIGKKFEQCAKNNGNWIELLANEYETLCAYKTKK